MCPNKFEDTSVPDQHQSPESLSRFSSLLISVSKYVIVWYFSFHLQAGNKIKVRHLEYYRNCTPFSR